MIDRRKTTGARGETIAADYLRRQGYTITTTNWRCRHGEIDIVAQDGPTLVFIEVRTRRSHGLGGPEESVTSTKRRRLAELAETYLQALEAEGRAWTSAWRIDLVALQLDRNGGTVVNLNHVINAVEGA